MRKFWRTEILKIPVGRVPDGQNVRNTSLVVGPHGGVGAVINDGLYTSSQLDQSGLLISGTAPKTRWAGEPFVHLADTWHELEVELLKRLV